METVPKKKRINYDYILIIATAVTLFLIALITVYGMYYFKAQGIGETNLATAKIMYYKRMNSLISPFLSILLLILSICVPKRLFSFRLLMISAGIMLVLMVVLSIIYNNVTALTVILFISLALQLVVFILVLFGMKLHFEKEGYWTRVGSSLVHLGFILFVLDINFLNDLSIHLAIFWSSTISISLGCILTFYTPSFGVKKEGKEAG